MSNQKRKTVPYDVSGVPPTPPSRKSRLIVKTPRRRTIEGKTYEEVPGSFAARVGSRRVDLVQLIEDGIPPIEYLPASDEMLRRGKRHYIAAPRKEGKSIAVLAHLVDMALADAEVVVLDRENGQELYASRLADVMTARKLSTKQRKQVGKRLSYYEFPTLKSGDAEDLVELLGAADLVVFDSQRMFLSDLGLREAESDDYASFMAYVIDPLFRAQVATLILDNTGHKEQTRGRGTSSKGDLNEILFSIETITPFDLYKRGKIKLKIEDSRMGNRGEWTMDLGGGYFYPWEQVNTDTAPRADFREAAEAALTDGKPRGMDKLIEAVRSGGKVKIATPHARHLLGEYAKDPNNPITHGPKGYERVQA